MRTKADTLAHYSAMRDEAVAQQQAGEFCGPLRRATLESPEFCITGSRFSQPCGLLKDGLFGAECDCLDATDFVPNGGARSFEAGGNAVYVSGSDVRGWF